MIENYKNKKISLQELEYEIKISEKINTELSKNFVSTSNCFYDNINKLLTAIAGTRFIILIYFILLMTNMYQYYRIIKI